jgi:hypothetical protein
MDALAGFLTEQVRGVLPEPAGIVLVGGNRDRLQVGP